MAKLAMVVPPPQVFIDLSGDRRDTATNKSRALAAAAKHGSMRAAITAGEVDRATLSRYLADGNFAENLKQVESALTARLTANLVRIAETGKEENQLKASEFLLPALDPRFDSGIRRQQVANRGAIDSLLMSKALEDSTVEIDPLAVSMPDNVAYQALESDGSEGVLVIEHNQTEPQESPTINKDEK